MSLTAWAKDDADNPQVATATADALESIKRQVLATHLTPGLTVQDLVSQIGGTDELDQTLRGAEQLGGARWLGDQVVQVRISIEGTRVAKTLVKIVDSHAKESPIPPETLQKSLKAWAGRTFSATGTSFGASDITRLRPPDSMSVWAQVSDADREQALRAAQSDAVNQVMNSLAPIALESSTLGAALTEQPVYEYLRDWLARQPVQEIVFGDDLVVHLTLSTPPDELWAAVKTALARQNHVPLPGSQPQWDRLEEQVIARAAPAVGSGAVPTGEKPVAPTVLPSKPPPWVVQRLEAEATSNSEGQKLRTARRAEALALEKLRAQIEALPLEGGTTVGQAAHQNPAIAKALAKAMGRAKPFKVDYGTNGSVTVHVSIGLSDVWGEIKL
jgi:hypothetical protein